MNRKDAEVIMRALRHYHRTNQYMRKYMEKEKLSVERIFESLLAEFDPEVYLQFTRADSSVEWEDRCLCVGCLGGKGNPCCESNGFGLGFITGIQVEIE